MLTHWHLSDEKADKVLKAVPIIPGDDTVFKVFEEKEEDQQSERATPHMMFSKAMKAVFDNLTSGASRRAEQEYNSDSATHREANSIEDWCCLDKKKSEPWTEQLVKLKSRLGSKKNTPEGRSILRNANNLTLSGGLLYYRYKPKYQIEEVKCFVVHKAHRRTAIDGCHCDTGHQGKERTESLISN